jgi:hypothetical protein
MTTINLRNIFAHGAGAAVTLFTILLALTAAPARAQDVAFSSDGSLSQPQGYREWVYVGTPLTPNDMNGREAAFPEFHNVYINPEAWDAYQRTGKFPDGTVLIKELVSVGSKEASSGQGYFMGEFIGLEAAVKDSKRFAKEPGYWAYFSFGHSYPLADATKAQKTDNCATCHQSRAADDFVFTQYYPVLRAAKGKGK